MHNNNERITLVYRGFGSLTFKLKSAKPLSESSLWEGTKDKIENVKCFIKFKDEHKFDGISNNFDDGSHFIIKGEL